jgi:hypothetical protein
MPKGVPYEQRVRELAFSVWRECGQNWSEAERRLRNEHDLRKLTRERLYDWAKADNWQDRAARLAAEEQRQEYAKLMGREATLADLMRQKQVYENYFAVLEGAKKVDTAATGAYIQLCKTITTLQDRLDAGAGKSNLQIGMDVVRHLSKFVREEYPQHAAAFLEILEPFGDRLVDIYG